MAIRYITAPGQPSFDVEVPQGPPEIEDAFGAAEPTAILITQLYLQRREYYARPAANDLCPAGIVPAGRTAYFCDDSPRRPTGVADLVTWTRTWATKPASFSDRAQVSVQMPARGAVFRFDAGTAGAPFDWYPYLGARSYSLPRLATILRAFFLIAPSGGDYTSVDSIPSLDETIYAGADVSTAGSGPLTDDQYTALPAQNVGLFSGAVLDPGGSTGGSGNVTYVASELTAGNYYVGQSQLRRYQGNIWERTATRITL